MMKRSMAGEIAAAGARGSIEMLMWGGAIWAWFCGFVADHFASKR